VATLKTSISVKKVVKRFGKFKAVKDVSFHVYEGETFSLLGPNGAGKTTLMLMISGIMMPSEGEIIVEGYNVSKHAVKVKELVGYCPQEPIVYDILTGEENLMYYAGLYGISRSEALNAIREGEIDACIVFPNKFSLNLTMGIPVHMNVYLSTADIQKLQITDGIIRGFLSEFSSKMAVIRAKMAIEYMRMFANYTEYIPMNFTFPTNQSRLMELWVMGLAQPMKISYAKIAPKGGRRGWGESMGWITLSMVGVQFLFAGMLSAAVTIAEERDKGTLRRMLAAPLSPWDVLLGYTLVILFEIVLSTIAIITYGTFVMHAKIYWNPLTNPVHIFIPIILLLAGLFSIGVGLIISMISRTSRTATLISQAISWPLMFLSGITYPKFMLPQVFRNFADVFPLTIAVETMKEIVVLGKGLEIIMTVLPYLTIVSITVYILGALAYRKIVEKMII